LHRYFARAVCCEIHLPLVVWAKPGCHIVGRCALVVLELNVTPAFSREFAEVVQDLQE